MSEKSKQSSNDPFKSLKFKGYCWAFTPPGEQTNVHDFVKFAKFYLCRNAKILWNDEVWEKYTDEEILVEYFAHLFSVDENVRKQFELELTTDGTQTYGEDVYAWLDRKVKENQEEMKVKLEQLPERVSFKPDQLDKEE